MPITHKFVSAKPDAGDPALVSSNAHNANHNYPAMTVFAASFGDDPYSTHNAPVGVTDPYGANYHTKVDLTYVDQARVVGAISQNAGNLPLKLAVQYSLDGVSAWMYLDGVDGPYVSLTLPVGPKIGAWINLVAGAKADVFLRWVSVGGNGSAVQWFHHYMQVR